VDDRLVMVKDPVVLTAPEELRSNGNADSNYRIFSDRGRSPSSTGSSSSAARDQDLSSVSAIFARLL
jgi:hypothetical protein